MNTEYELKMERRKRVIDKIAATLLIIIYCILLLILDVIYLIFWLGRADTTILDNITAEQIEIIENECMITIPEDAKNIKLTSKQEYLESRNSYYLYYETPEYTDGVNVKVKDHYSGDISPSPLEKMLSYGYTPALDWNVEIFYLDSVITLIIAIHLLIKRKKNKEKRLKELQDQFDNKYNYKHDFEL